MSRRCDHDILYQTLLSCSLKRTRHELYKFLGINYNILDKHLKRMKYLGWITQTKNGFTTTETGKLILEVYDLTNQSIITIQKEHYRQMDIFYSLKQLKNNDIYEVIKGQTPH